MAKDFDNVIADLGSFSAPGKIYLSFEMSLVYQLYDSILITKARLDFKMELDDLSLV
jgi:hypothetical protein